MNGLYISVYALHTFVFFNRILIRLACGNAVTITNSLAFEEKHLVIRVSFSSFLILFSYYITAGTFVGMACVLLGVVLCLTDKM